MRLFKRGPSANEFFTAGMDAFADKEYPLAYTNFMRAYKITKDIRTQINSLINAAAAKEKAKDLITASQLLLHAVNLKALIKYSNKDIIHSLRKAYNLCSKTTAPKLLSEISALLMYYSIATKELALAKRLYDKIMESTASDSLDNFAIELYDLLKDRSPELWDREKLFNLPSALSDHKNILNSVIEVIKSTSALSIQLASTKSRVRVGENLSVTLTIKNFTPLTIKRIFFNPGGKGIISGGLEEDGKAINLVSNQEIKFEYNLEAQLTGTWIAGPVLIIYEIQGREYEIANEIIKLEIEEGIKELGLLLELEEIEEDFEFEIFSQLENTGKTIIDNIKVVIKIPAESKVLDGAPEKSIFSLSPGDKFNFSNKIRFESGILGKKYPIKLIATFEGGDRVEEEILLNGKIHS